jgi:hypothetical protein
LLVGFVRGFACLLAELVCLLGGWLFGFRLSKIFLLIFSVLTRSFAHSLRIAQASHLCIDPFLDALFLRFHQVMSGLFFGGVTHDLAFAHHGEVEAVDNRLRYSLLGELARGSCLADCLDNGGLDCRQRQAYSNVHEAITYTTLKI